MPSLRAAVAAGADAVYLGLDELNARRGAENFTRETIGEACRFAHLHGVLIYLTANVVILPDEMATAVEMIDAAWAAGVDAVIVQDLGLLSVLRTALPHVRVHASTQLNTHSSSSVRALADVGVTRVTLAREVDLEEIEVLVAAGREVGVEIESFVHGALCICYSGQCLLSSMVGGRSANRGLCAQPCRLPYELVDEAARSLGDVGAHLLSPKDLAGITVLPQFVQSGVASLKIEGRMKSPEYVALVTGVYRAALDRASAAPEAYEVRDGELSVLSEAFSRGFTEGYLIGERGNAMMSYRRPNNRGVPVGRIAASRGGRATIDLDVPIESEDTLEFWTSRGRFAQAAGALEMDGRNAPSAPAGSRVDVSVENPVSAGDRVFRVRNAALAQAARRLFEPQYGPDIALAFTIEATVGGPFAVTVSDETGRSARAEGDRVEPARTRAVTADELIEHVGRLGNTPYAAASWDVELSPGVGISFSSVHRTRREALAAYEETVLDPWSGRVTTRPTLPQLERRTSASKPPRLVADTSSLETAIACLAAGADEAHVPAFELVDQEVPVGVVPVLPRVMHDRESARLLDVARGAGRGVAATLGALSDLSTDAVAVQAHWSLNAVNPYALQELARLGAEFVWLSPELSITQLSALSTRTPVGLGTAISGRQELMVTEHCVLMAEGECSGRCDACRRRRGTRMLLDRKGYKFPVVTDARGRTHLYNSIAFDAVRALPEIVGAGMSALRIDVHTLDATSAVQEVARVRRALQGHEVEERRSATTTGHLFRGVR